MSTVAFMVWILAACSLMYAINSCWVADFSGAVLTWRSTLRERNRQPVSGITTSKMATAW